MNNRVASCVAFVAEMRGSLDAAAWENGSVASSVESMLSRSESERDVGGLTDGVSAAAVDIAALDVESETESQVGASGGLPRVDVAACGATARGNVAAEGKDGALLDVCTESSASAMRGAQASVTGVSAGVASAAAAPNSAAALRKTARYAASGLHRGRALGLGLGLHRVQRRSERLPVRG